MHHTHFLLYIVASWTQADAVENFSLSWKNFIKYFQSLSVFKIQYHEIIGIEMAKNGRVQRMRLWEWVPRFYSCISAHPDARRRNLYLIRTVLNTQMTTRAARAALSISTQSYYCSTIITGLKIYMHRPRYFYLSPSWLRVFVLGGYGTTHWQ